MRFPIKEELKNLRERFPKGCRIVLDCMDDVQAPKPGTQGVCREWTMPEMSWLPGIREGHSASLLGPTHATVWLLMKRSGKASAGLGKADTGARTAPGAGCVRNQQTVSSL